MPTVSVSEDTKKYLDRIRRLAPRDNLPNLKEISDLVISFVKEHEKEFLDSIKEKSKNV